MVHQTLRGYLGTYQTVPELAANPYTPRTKQSDIYMFGLIAQYVGHLKSISMACADSSFVQILSIGFTDVDRRYQILRDELQYLGDGCCAKDPLNRPSADDIIVQFRRFKASHPDDSIKARTAADNSPYSRS
jgi:hypothetical protein